MLDPEVPRGTPFTPRSARLACGVPGSAPTPIAEVWSKVKSFSTDSGPGSSWCAGDFPFFLDPRAPAAPLFPSRSAWLSYRTAGAGSAPAVDFVSELKSFSSLIGPAGDDLRAGGFLPFLDPEVPGGTPFFPRRTTPTRGAAWVCPRPAGDSEERERFAPLAPLAGGVTPRPSRLPLARSRTRTVFSQSRGSPRPRRGLRSSGRARPRVPRGWGPGKGGQNIIKFAPGCVRGGCIRGAVGDEAPGRSADDDESKGRAGPTLPLCGSRPPCPLPP